MRTGFGRFAMELRSKRGMSLSRFSEIVDMSAPRICNIEFGRAPATDDVLGCYIKALDLKGDDAHELRARASFSNGLQRSVEEERQNPPLHALFEAFANQLSPKAVAEIQSILERESGRTVSSLAFASNQMLSKSNKARKPRSRPIPSPKRFVEICLLAEEVRAKVAHEMSPVKIGLALERLAITEERLDYRVVEALPSFMAGAFACIVGQKDGHIILIEARRFKSAESGVYFVRHVIGHEMGHHYLHPRLLQSDGEVYVAPQALSKNTPEMIGTERQIEQVVDSIEEAEAELFATMFLVPWTAFLKGTGFSYLARDYGEQPDEVKRYAPYFKNPAVIDAFRFALWERGVRLHPVFSLN
jgi:transcriptional regulator with XRE-family HTH domain